MGNMESLCSEGERENFDKEEFKVEGEAEGKFDRAKGCVVGALMGDAIGAVLEFYGSKITGKIAAKALAMPGGGVHKVGKGQITDDGELTMWLLHALAGSDGRFDNKKVTKFYAKWIESKPFDIGNTCRRSLFKARVKNPDPERVKKEAKKSDGSQSNGSLMRWTPLAILCCNMGIEEYDGAEQDLTEHREWVFKAAREDAEFTHSNELVIFVEGLYVLMLTMIINKFPLQIVYDTITKEISESSHEDLQIWLEESQEENLGKLHSKMGWIKHAFVCCLRYLRLSIECSDIGSEFYQECMIEILKKGGDTDTNAWIVGGMLGAIIGFDNLPELPKEKVLSWPKGGRDGRRRPEFLWPSKNVEELIQKLYESAKGELEIQ